MRLLRHSLIVHILGAPALFALIGVIFVGIELVGQKQRIQHLRYRIETRQSLENILFRLLEKHTHTTQRARNALFESTRERQLALLSRIAGSYNTIMEDAFAEAKQIRAKIDTHSKSEAIELDFDRFKNQINLIQQQSQSIQPALDDLLNALSFDETEPLLEAQHNFSREDYKIQNALRLTLRLIQKMNALQLARLSNPTLIIPLGVWLVYLIGMLASFLIARLPIKRLGHLLRSDAKIQPRTTDEKDFINRQDYMRQEHNELHTRLEERDREIQRALGLSRRVEHELALLKLYHENLVNSLKSAIIVTDAAGLLTNFNRTARRVLGLENNTLQSSIHEHPFFYALVDRRPDAKSDLEHAIDRKRIQQFEGIAYKNGPSEILLDLTLVPYLDESGAARGLIWVIDDVTDAIQTKKQLLAAERLAAVGSISAQVAHEIRNPLSAIGLNAELLEEEFSAKLEGESKQEVIALLKAIASEIERLSQITEGYLQLTRLPQPNLRTTNLNQLIVDIFNLLDEELKSHGIEFQLQLHTPAPQAQMDPGQMRQALLNIIRNSREAMSKGGSIQVQTRTTSEHHEIEFCDSGQGIPEHIIPRIFEPFFTTKPEGTGLGLSLTHQIINDHNGHIEVHANKPQGTIICLSFAINTT